MGHTDVELGLPDAERYARDDQEVIATGQPKRHLIEPMVTRTGLHWMQTDKIPYRDETGQIVGVIGFAIDITERKRVGEMQARLAAIVESSDDAIVGKTLDGIITSWNPGAEKVFGYSAEETVGKSIPMLIPPERADEEPKLLAWLAGGKSMDHFETVRIRKDGKRIDVAETVSPLQGQPRPGSSAFPRLRATLRPASGGNARDLAGFVSGAGSQSHRGTRRGRGGGSLCQSMLRASVSRSAQQAAGTCFAGRAGRGGEDFA